MKATGRKRKPLNRIHPSECPACWSRRYETLGIMGTVAADGTLPDGDQYRSIIRKRVQCRDCGNVYVRTAWELKESSD